MQIITNGDVGTKSTTDLCNAVAKDVRNLEDWSDSCNCNCNVEIDKHAKTSHIKSVTKVLASVNVFRSLGKTNMFSA